MVYYDIWQLKIKFIYNISYSTILHSKDPGFFFDIDKKYILAIRLWLCQNYGMSIRNYYASLIISVDNLKNYLIRIYY
jgi:hypothetical protein